MFVGILECPPHVPQTNSNFVSCSHKTQSLLEVVDRRLQVNKGSRRASENLSNLRCKGLICICLLGCSTHFVSMVFATNTTRVTGVRPLTSNHVNLCTRWLEHPSKNTPGYSEPICDPTDPVHQPMDSLSPERRRAGTRSAAPLRSAAIFRGQRFGRPSRIPGWGWGAWAGVGWGG